MKNKIELNIHNNDTNINNTILCMKQENKNILQKKD